ncbi:MAG: formate dehydrogenase accessory protein FdhE [bacterium]
MEEFISKDELACFEELDSLKAKYKKKLGFPLPLSLPIELEKIGIDKGVFNEMFDRIVGVIEKYSHQKIERKTCNLKELVENGKRGDFISINILKPIFERIAESLKDKIPSYWNKGYCPVCGGLPLMSGLRKEDGKRFLQCMLCKTEWEFLRIKCPYCESEKYLKFFQTSDESPFRVDVCDHCKFYIKTLDQRKMDILNLEKMDIETRYLDILAIKEGYKKIGF